MDKTFEALGHLKDIEIELHRLKNALDMMNRAHEAKKVQEDIKPEPVGWINPNEKEHEGYAFSFKNVGVFTVPLYTAPPKREWVSLTSQDKSELYRLNAGRTYDDLMCAFEDKLKERNI